MAQHREEFVFVPHVTHDSAIIAWGAFFFEVEKDGEMDLIDADEEYYKKLRPPFGPRYRGGIGAGTDGYGPAEVRLFRLSGPPGAGPLEAGQTLGITEARTRQIPFRPDEHSDKEAKAKGNGTEYEPFVRLAGLKPNTWYRYEVWVGGQRWSARPKDPVEWSAKSAEGRFAPAREHRCVFQTFPSPAEEKPVSFIVLGDPGTRQEHQFRVAEAIERFLDTPQGREVRFAVTTGDNIYVRKGGGFLPTVVEVAGGKLLGDPRSSGDEDDDWYDAYFWPYRRIISRLPIYPCLGNHDSGETEHEIDLRQLTDNLFLAESFPQYASRWISNDEMQTAVFYEFVCGKLLQMIAIDTSTPGVGIDEILKGKAKVLPGFHRTAHKNFLDQVLNVGANGPRWQIPFGHHPPYSYGPGHGSEPSVIQLMEERFWKNPRFALLISGHEHNFQHHRVQNGAIHYIVSGASGKQAKKPGNNKGKVPNDVRCCTTNEVHFLYVRVERDRILVHPTGIAGELQRERIGGYPAHGPIEIASRK
jgi:hypothetical protein